MIHAIREKLAKFVIDTISFRNTHAKNIVLQKAEGATFEGCFLKGNITAEAFVAVRRAHLDGTITIGRYTQINGPNVFIMGGVHAVSIGKFCSVARNVTIQEHNHNHNRISTFFFQKHFFAGGERGDVISSGRIEIGNDVWIGANATILSGVKIGNGAVIAANALVTKDVAPYTVVGGTPAVALKKRFSEEVIDALMKLEWWNWDREKIKRNESLFRLESPDVDALRNIE
jgi:virginiamycin A acetyltransferase